MSILASLILVDKYELQEKLGEGTFGSVFAATDTEKKVEVAIKQIYIQKYTITE
jgi:serine/threonine protein kinase